MSRARDVEVTFLAAAVAYYALLSMIPLVVFLFYVVSQLNRSQVEGMIVKLTGGFFPPDLRENLAEMMVGGVETVYRFLYSVS